jgi:hypothetical protein
MKVFISWSGQQSREVARALDWWLPKVIQSIEPFFSEEDMPKGRMWFSTLAKELKDAKAGIICLTPENLEKPWILFEAGAVWKSLEDHVFTYLYNLKATDFSPPLSEFQHTTIERTDTLKLIKNINSLQEKPIRDSDLEEIFGIMWPHLDERLSSISKEIKEIQEPSRDNEDMLKELLSLAREQNKLLSDLLKQNQSDQNLDSRIKDLSDELKQHRSVHPLGRPPFSD